MVNKWYYPAGSSRLISWILRFDVPIYEHYYCLQKNSPFKLNLQTTNNKKCLRFPEEEEGGGELEGGIALSLYP